MGRYDEVIDALGAGDLETIRNRVLPEALVSKKGPCLPLAALRADHADAAEIILATFSNDPQRKRLEPPLTTPLGKLVQFLDSTLMVRTVSEDDAREAVKLAWDAGWRPVGDGHEELAASLRQPVVLDALLAVLPPRTPEQLDALGATLLRSWTFAQPESQRRVLAMTTRPDALMIAAIEAHLPLAVEVLLARGAASGPALDHARAQLERESAAGQKNHAGDTKKILKLLDTSPKPTKSSKPATIDAELRALGKACGVPKDAIDDALEHTSDAEMPRVVRVMAAFGLALSDADREADGDVFLTVLLGQAHDGRTITAEDCEHADAVREVIADGTAIATVNRSMLFTWTRDGMTEVWEVGRHGAPVVHESVLAWLSKRRVQMHAVE